MTPTCIVPLSDRGALRVGGDDRVNFLQGLVSNDVRRVTVQRAIHAAFLTPQGKYLHDFFIVDAGDALLLDCEGARAEDLLRRLSRFRLRAGVELEDVGSSHLIAAVIGEGGPGAVGLDGRAAGTATPFGGGVAYVDPRLKEAGARLLLPRDGAEAVLRGTGLSSAAPAVYDRHRLALGLPDGSRDMEVDKAILLECGFDELGGVDWEKGCYLGQELTARTKYRALIRKRLVPVDVAGAPPPPGTAILQGDREVGQLRSSCDGRALALVRVDSLKNGDRRPLLAAGVPLTPALPFWLKLP
jgi:folate-binding protein YgfZ